MAKKIRNTTGSNIELAEVGILIIPAQEVVLEWNEYLRWSTPLILGELTPYLNSGDLVFNDGTVDLTASDAIRALKYADRAYIQKDNVDVTRVNTILNFEGDVSVTDNSNGKATVKINPTSGYDTITHFRNEAGTRIMNYESCSQTHIPAGPYVVIDLAGNIVRKGS